jgi:UV DNA damage endonuclease
MLFLSRVAHHIPCLRNVLRKCHSAHFATARITYLNTQPSQTSVTMVPKRKSTNMALMQEDIPSEDRSTPNERVDSAPRRSGRASKNVDGMHLDCDAADKNNSLSKGTGPRAKKHGAREIQDPPPTVDSAMDDLKAMESRLRKSVKRQKLAIGASEVMGSSTQAQPEDLAFLPRATRSAQSTLPLSKEQNHLGTVPFPPPDNKRQVFPENDAADSEVEAENELPPEDAASMKQDGARPPPVNSGYLPLPWKGRLGYVNIPLLIQTSLRDQCR